MSVRFPASIEAADEAFWQKQEARKRGYLGQPCCTQSKMSWALMDLPGDFAVVVHGEYDCLNCFHHHLGVSAHRFYSSRLTDHAITTGEVQAPLERLLRLLVRDRRPTAIVVLGTCPVEVTGDRFEVVAERVQADTGTPILAMHTSGLRMTSLTDCQDWLFDSLASLAVPPPDDLPPRVNLLGLPDAHPEPREVLGALGIEVNAFLPHGATLDDWRRLRSASATVAVDAGLWRRLTRRLVEDFDHPVVDAPLPVGHAASAAFHRAAAGALGRAADVDAVLEDRSAAAAAAVAAGRVQVAGARVALAIRVLNTSQVDRLVQEGLGELSQLTELGLDVSLLVQGPPEEGPRFRERLRDRGHDLPVIPFGGPYQFAEAVTEGGFVAVMASDSYRNLARRAGVPFLASRALAPWLGGVPHNVSILVDWVRQGQQLGAGA